jgi:hypothetical protein
MEKQLAMIIPKNHCGLLLSGKVAAFIWLLYGMRRELLAGCARYSARLFDPEDNATKVQSLIKQPALSS